MKDPTRCIFMTLRIVHKLNITIKKLVISKNLSNMAERPWRSNKVGFQAWTF